MLPINNPPALSQVDRALIECLRVFARRGRDVRTQLKKQTVDSDILGGAALSTAQQDNHQRSFGNELFYSRNVSE